MAVERDFPEGHPASVDYKGERYTPPRAPHSADYDEKHPAYAGKNTTALDTPDGMREQVLLDHEENIDRTRHMQRTVTAPQAQAEKG
jgi:hypothetical protein